MQYNSFLLSHQERTKTSISSYAAFIDSIVSGTWMSIILGIFVLIGFMASSSVMGIRENVR
jgi:hypothetical protein